MSRFFLAFLIAIVVGSVTDTAWGSEAANVAVTVTEVTEQAEAMAAGVGVEAVIEEIPEPLLAGATTGELEVVQTNLNYVWILAAAALIFLMQAGFMCVETGLTRAKNSINVSIKNLADFLIAGAAFWAVGFGIMFGTSWMGLFGTDGYFIELKDNSWAAVFFVFQAVFCGTAATIDSGAVAERTRFGSYLIMSLLISVLVYPVFGHWAWGSFLNGETQGWLEARGFIDFAGSTVVHSVGGWVALAGVIVIGPRVGKFDENGKPRKIRAHNLPMTYLGVFILFFGWFGFNCGSTLAANLDIAGIAMNTLLAACFGGLTSSALSWILSKDKLPEPEMIANGVLGGLVGITAGCAVLETGGAALIGITSGVVVFCGTYLMEHVFKLDDVVGAVPVHGMCGAWGTIGLAFFMPETALGGAARMSVIGTQALGVGAGFVWAFGTAIVILWLINKITPMRVTPEEEKIGLNVAEHGATSTILDLAHAMHHVTVTGEYDDSVKVEVEHGTEGGDLAFHFNLMVDAVAAEKQAVQQAEEEKVRMQQEYMQYMEQTVGAIQEETRNMEELLQDTSMRAEGVSQSLDRASIHMSELLESLDTVSADCDQASTTATKGQEDSAQSRGIVGALGESATHIGDVITAIEDIAGATRLLALNAGIEASRAGEAGRGFSVVAENIRDLSEKSEVSVEQIRDQISEMRDINEKAVGSIGAIADAIDVMGQLNLNISSSVGDEAKKANEVSGVVAEVTSSASDMRLSLGNVAQGAQRVAERVGEAYSELLRRFGGEPESAAEDKPACAA